MDAISSWMRSATLRRLRSPIGRKEYIWPEARRQGGVVGRSGRTGRRLSGQQVAHRPPPCAHTHTYTLTHEPLECDHHQHHPNTTPILERETHGARSGDGGGARRSSRCSWGSDAQQGPRAAAPMQRQRAGHNAAGADDTPDADWRIKPARRSSWCDTVSASCGAARSVGRNMVRTSTRATALALAAPRLGEWRRAPDGRAGTAAHAWPSRGVRHTNHRAAIDTGAQARMVRVQPV